MKLLSITYFTHLYEMQASAIMKAWHYGIGLVGAFVWQHTLQPLGRALVKDL
jgi:hypothetical protein